MKNYHEIIVHQRPIDPRRVVLMREQYADLKKELLLCCCNLVWINGGLVLRYVTAICEVFKSSWPDGKTPYEWRLENHLIDY